MKILAIRLKNLASLAGPHEIDFTAAPLARAGLFAIVGPTGSGKSTLLDALCLAIFGKTPRLRLAPGRASHTPDGENDPLATSDARTLLRRGTSGGYAEADFLGQDQRRYRSRWEVRRARGRVGGRLQPVERSLTDLETGAILATQTQEHELLIEQRLGLSFDQFTRAVLLAQAEFGNFLKANDKERAELLEKLTDSARFSQISKCAFARKRAADEAVDQLKRESGGFIPLDAAARSELDAQLDLAAQGAASWKQRALGLHTLREWWQRFSTVRDNLQQWQTALDGAEREHAQLDAERHELKLLVAAAPIRDSWRECERVRAASAVNALELEKNALQQRDAQQRWDVLTAQHGQAAIRDQRVRAEVQAQQPHLRSAQTLENAIALMLNDQQRLGQQHAQLQQRHDQAAERVAAARIARELAANERTQIDGELAARHAWHELHAGWSAHRLNLTEYVAALELQRGLEHRAPQLRELVHGAERALHAATLAALAADIQCNTAQAALGALVDVSAQLTALRVELDRESAARERLNVRITELATICSLQQDCAKLSERLRELEQAAGAVARQVEDAQLTFARTTELHQQLQALIERLRLARSAQVGQMRAGLIDGDACPVCGSLEHPYAHAPELLEALTGADEQELGRARAEQESARADWQNRQRAHAELMARHAEIRNNHARISAELGVRIVACFAARAAHVDPAFASHQLSQVREQHAALEQHLAAGRAHAVELERLQSQRELRDTERERCLREREHTLNARHAALRERDQAVLAEQSQQGTRQQCQAQLDQRGPQLRAVLTPQCWIDLQAEPVAARIRIHNELAAYGALHVHQQALLSVELTRVHELEERASDVAALALPLRESALGLDALRSELTGRQQSLRALLGEQAHAQAWAQCLDAQIAAADARLQGAAGELHKAEQSLCSLAERASHLDLERSSLQQALAPLSLTIAQFQELAPSLDSCILARLCTLAPGLIEDLRRRVDQAERSLLGARLRVLERGDELVAHEGLRMALWQRFRATLDTPPAISTVELPLWAGLEPRTQIDPAEVSEIDSAFTLAARHQERCSAEHDDLRVRVLEDQQRLIKLASLGAALALANAERQRWGQISDLIGSADGAAFRAIAQACNLDILLALANEHLLQLAPRYRLRRSGADLGLLVIDRDMGEALRSVHSLSGGESFLVSLALALGLAAMSSRRLRIQSLFIDEGFGALDAQSLDLALDALEGLHALGRKVGVISHIPEMHERIPVQIRVVRAGQGLSTLDVVEAR